MLSKVILIIIFGKGFASPCKDFIFMFVPFVMAESSKRRRPFPWITPRHQPNQPYQYPKYQKKEQRMSF